MESPAVPVSWGELLDKISILEIKRDRIDRPEALANVEREYGLLSDLALAPLQVPEIATAFDRLKRINETLWEVEDAIREQEAEARFGASFVALARSVYHTNDERAAIKREINALLGSELVEEKSYSCFTAATIPAPVAGGLIAESAD